MKTKETVSEPRVDLAKVEELWGPGPWELHLDTGMTPDAMERVGTAYLDGIRFVRAPERDWDDQEVTD